MCHPPGWFGLASRAGWWSTPRRAGPHRSARHHRRLPRHAFRGGGEAPWGCGSGSRCRYRPFASSRPVGCSRLGSRFGLLRQHSGRGGVRGSFNFFGGHVFSWKRRGLLAGLLNSKRQQSSGTVSDALRRLDHGGFDVCDKDGLRGTPTAGGAPDGRVPGGHAGTSICDCHCLGICASCDGSFLDGYCDGLGGGACTAGCGDVFLGFQRRQVCQIFCGCSGSGGLFGFGGFIIGFGGLEPSPLLGGRGDATTGSYLQLRALIGRFFGRLCAQLLRHLRTG
mmetsp:Transcript_72959/g.205542  ORF Transcript_72959/g.205542 Transcript_72959/m.205542 type:complete len:280 (-) Transcript_72959:145-984(-)